MANIDRIVKVAIALRTAGVQQLSFSDMMLMDVHEGPDRVAIITRPDDLLDGFGLDETSDLYRAAQVHFSQIPSTSRLFIGKRVADETTTQALAAIRIANNTWYGFSDVSHAEANLLDAAGWAEANEKLFLTALSDPDILLTTGEEPATALKTGQFFRTAWWFNPDNNTFPEVAIASKMFTINPGGETWANQRLAAVPSTPLTEGQYANVRAKSGNTFEPFRNLAMTQNGLTAGGEWIDVIRFRDWQAEQVKTEVFQLFVDNRIPYTDEGIAAIRQRMIAALDLGVRRGGIAPPAIDPDNPQRVIPSYTTSVPARVNISSLDVAARILRDVNFTARLAGAIHAVEINGTLTYDNIG